MKVLILGANGLCGTSLVPLIEDLFPDLELILVDPDEESGPRIIRAAPKADELWHILPALGLKKGDAIIDLTTDLNKLDVIQVADTLGISVINATMCAEGSGSLSMVDVLDERLHFAKHKWNAPHMAGCGMNPGNINALLGLLVTRFGKPVDVTQWEMDTTIPFKWDGEGFATWSPSEFASEWGDEATWEMDGRKVLWASGPPIDNIWKMPNGNFGTLCQHEELIKWAWKYDCKARYLYGYSPKAMDAIEKNIRDGFELPLCRKLKWRVPTGKDTIALQVEFEGGYAKGSFSFDNSDKRIPIGSNATSYLVACGVCAALSILQGGLPEGLNWPDDHGEDWIGFLMEENLCEIEVDSDLSPRMTAALPEEA